MMNFDAAVTCTLKRDTTRKGTFVKIILRITDVLTGMSLKIIAKMKHRKPMIRIEPSTTVHAQGIE